MHRHAGRILFVMLLVATGLAPVRALATGPRPQRLAGTTVMAVDGPSVAEIVLPRPVRFWHPWFDAGRPDFRIDGGSGLAMFALVDTDGDVPARGLVGGRLPEDARSEVFLTEIELGPDGSDWKGYWDVPAGSYRLYVFTDDPVRLTLSLKGLEGRVKVRPAAPARYEVKRPESLVDPGPAKNLYSAGATGSLDGRIAQFQVLWTDEAAHLSSQTGFCWYDGEPSDATTAYMPGCPFADSQDVVEITGDFVGDWFSVATGIRLPVPSGRSGQGMWFASAAAIRQVGHLAAWLDLGL